ncbi:HAD family phosphatase [Brachyspira pilosicoli]|uniref:HAD family hydrolase n=1 Tax=Brachyspira pilosicoli TaxID=52584 RepID=UPI001C684061|nr:HAD family phosphatase [Brachyspira pilosicoli]MBW5396670.1 HAD family phosphatase [Brachyspira pilosicoli]
MTDIKLLIFDMDGTLIDSAYLNYYSYSNAFREFNIELDEEYYYKKCFGLHYKTFVSNILDLNKITEDKDALIEKIHTRKEEIYLNNLNLLNIHPFIYDTILSNRGKKKLALATTASPNGVYGILKAFKLDEVFDLVLTGADITNKKPHPEIFFKCMDYFNVSNKEIIIFEDSEVGLEAAYGTKAWVIKVEKWVK